MESTKRLRCEWRTFPREIYMCTTDQPEWFEKVDLRDGFFESGLCVSGLLIGQPASCLGYAKWFVESIEKILKQAAAEMRGGRQLEREGGAPTKNSPLQSHWVRLNQVSDYTLTRMAPLI